MALKDYLPSEKHDAIVQARVNKDLLKQVRIKLKKDGLKIVDLIRAAFLDYLNDSTKTVTNPTKRE